MEAIDTKLANLVYMPEGVCSADCPLAHGHRANPDFLQVSVDGGEELPTGITVSSFNGRLRTTEIRIPGALRASGVTEMLNKPTGDAVDDGHLACNALCALAAARRGE
ncbi:MAG TPA: hypothetical protein VFP35_03520 [Candidatus Saccharimonadales bacterium]|nr:hypothetical protein [Candidatus Saccharimonadales bacterium]